MAGSRTVTYTFVADVDNFEKGVEGARRKASDFFTGIQKDITRLASGKQLAGAFKDVGSAMTASFTLPIVAGFGAVIKASSDFDREMTKSLAIMGPISDDLRRKMEENARSVAKTYGVSHAEAARSYYSLASAGLTAQQSMSALPQVAMFAKAGMMEMGQATDLLVGSQTALGLSFKDPIKNAQELVHVSDVLVNANNGAIGSVQAFAEALSNKSAAAMRTYHQTVEQGTAVLMAYAQAGIQGATAGERYDILIRELTKAALENAGAFKTAKVAVFDQAGALRPMGDIIGDIEKRFAGMSDAQRVAELGMLGIKAKSQSAILGLLGMSQAIRDNEKTLHEQGSTALVAQKQMQSFSEQLNLLKVEAVDVAISLGQTLLPVAKSVVAMAKSDLVPAVQGAVTWFKNLPPSVQEAGIGFLAFLAIVGPASYVIGSAAGAIGTVTKAMKLLMATNTATWAVGTIQGLTGIKMGLGALTLAGAQIVAAGGIGYWIGGGLDSLLQKLKSVAPQIYDMINPLDRLMQLFASAGDHKMEEEQAYQRGLGPATRAWIAAGSKKVTPSLTGLGTPVAPGYSVNKAGFSLDTWMSELGNTASGKGLPGLGSAFDPFKAIRESAAKATPVVNGLGGAVDDLLNGKKKKKDPVAEFLKDYKSSFDKNDSPAEIAKAVREAGVRDFAAIPKIATSFSYNGPSFTNDDLAGFDKRRKNAWDSVTNPNVGAINGMAVGDRETVKLPAAQVWDFAKSLDIAANGVTVLGLGASRAGQLVGNVQAGLARMSQVKGAFEKRDSVTGELMRDANGKVLTKKWGALDKNEKLGVGMEGLNTAIAAYKSGSILGGAASGASFGAAFGVPGALIGGAVGGLLGLFGKKKAPKPEPPKQADAAAIKSFTSDQLSAGTAGLSAGVGGIQLTSAADLTAQATIAGLQFWSIFKTQGITAAAGATKDVIGKLVENLAQFGSETATAVLAPIQQQIALAENEQFKSAAEGAKGFGEALAGQVNARLPMTIEQFSAFGQQASAAFEQAKAGAIATGLSTEAATKAALTAVGPLVQGAVDASGVYGFAIDANTQSLLDQAAANGVAFATDKSDRLVMSIDALTAALGGVPPAITKIADALHGIPSSVNTSVNVTTNKRDAEGDSDVGPGYAGGSGGLVDFGRETLARLHGREAVLTEGQYSRLTDLAATGMSFSANGSSFNNPGSAAPIIVQNTIVMPDGRVLLSVTTEALRTEGLEAQDHRMALAGKR